MEYKYTYKFRGLSIGCQPKDFIRFENDKKYKFEILTYNRELTEKELNEYELYKIN